MERRIHEEQAMLKARLEARKVLPASTYLPAPEESKHRVSIPSQRQHSKTSLDSLSMEHNPAAVKS